MPNTDKHPDATWLQKLQTQGIEYIRILFCDNANIIRGKAVHLNTLLERYHCGVSIAQAQQAIPVMYDVVASGTGLTPVGEVWLIPDWDTLQVLPYAPTHASVLGTMHQGGQPWELCPRRFLRQMIDRAAQQGLNLKAAFENEFYLLRPTPDGFEPVDHSPFASTLAMDVNRGVIDEITQALIAQGISVECYYPESGPGQQEISVRYSDPLTTGDRQIRFRETVRGVALNRGLIASFLPKIFAEQAGSGCHLHYSLWDGKTNLIPDHTQPGTLSPLARQFMAGILHHLPALMAITTPCVNSYRRLAPHCWSGAFTAWGVDNREAALRVPTNFTPPSPTHVELKTVDATANPYLALGTIIAAGLDGIEKNLALPDPVTVDPGTLSAEQQRAQKISRLPQSLGEAIAKLEQDTVLTSALGSSLTQVFIGVRKVEWDALKEKTLPEEVSLLLRKY